MKRSGQVAAIDPIKAVADQQAVEIQEMLDALTSPVAEGVALRGTILPVPAADVPPGPDEPAIPATPNLPKLPGQPDPNLPPPDSTGVGAPHPLFVGEAEREDAKVAADAKMGGHVDDTALSA